MNLIHRILLCLIVVTLLAVGVLFLKARTAAAEADRAVGRMTSVLEQIQTIERLNAQTPDWAQRTRPALGPGGLATAANDALAAAGVPASALASLSPAAETPVSLDAGAGARGGGFTAFRRRAVLTLAPVTLPQVGSFLKAWREAHPSPDWTIASIDLTPEPAGRRDAALPAPPSPGTDLPLRAVISIESLYVERSASSASLPSAPGARR